MTDTVSATVIFVKKTLKNAEGGHDWFHIERVWKLAKTIATEENANLLVVELAALLHDIADSKFNNGDEKIGPIVANEFLKTLSIDQDTKTHVLEIIKNISFKGGKTKPTINTIEFFVCRDADRMDAIGAIGIARAFNYGGFKNRALYDPNLPPNLQMTKEEYKHSAAPTINHFYEKLLLLKGSMHTATAKKMAAHRHQFMIEYLDEFYMEFEGRK